MTYLQAITATAAKSIYDRRNANPTTTYRIMLRYRRQAKLTLYLDGADDVMPALPYRMIIYYTTYLLWMPFVLSPTTPGWAGMEAMVAYTASVAVV